MRYMKTRIKVKQMLIWEMYFSWCQRRTWQKSFSEILLKQVQCQHSGRYLLFIRKWFMFTIYWQQININAHLNATKRSFFCDKSNLRNILFFFFIESCKIVLKDQKRGNKELACTLAITSFNKISNANSRLVKFWKYTNNFSKYTMKINCYLKFLGLCCI